MNVNRCQDACSDDTVYNSSRKLRRICHPEVLLALLDLLGGLGFVVAHFLFWRCDDRHSMFDLPLEIESSAQIVADLGDEQKYSVLLISIYLLVGCLLVESAAVDADVVDAPENLCVVSPCLLHLNILPMVPSTVGRRCSICIYIAGLVIFVFSIVVVVEEMPMYFSLWFEVPNAPPGEKTTRFSGVLGASSCPILLCMFLEEEKARIAREQHSNLWYGT